MADPDTLYCYVHPDRETQLRCNNCERPICAKCAVLTPTGYRCQECVRGQQKSFDTAGAADYILAPLACGVLSYLGSLLVPMLGFFTIFLAPLAGTAIGEVAARVTGRRRSKALFQAATGAVALGALVRPLLSLLALALGLSWGGFNIYGLLPLIYQAVYLVLSVGAFYYRMTGIRL